MNPHSSLAHPGAHSSALVVTFLACLSAVGGQPLPATCDLTIELIDAADGSALPGLIRVEAENGDRVPLSGLPPRGLGVRASAPVHDWFVLTQRSTVQVEQRQLVLRAVHGLVTETATVQLDLRGQVQATARIPLRRFFDTTRRGYRSANTHVHLKEITREEAEDYLRAIPQADDLDIVFVSNLERINDDRTYISNRFTRDDFKRLSRSGTLFGNGEEHRHNFNGYQGYGHVMFLDIKKLILPVSIGPGIMKSGTDGIPLQRGIDTARADGATVI